MTDEWVEKDKLYIKSLVERYGIYEKDILSIGSGTSEEEYLFSLYGKNRIDCVDICFGTMYSSLTESEEYKDTMSRMKQISSRIQDYVSDKQYDIIYANSPGDWMNNKDCVSACGEAIPIDYANIFNKFGNESALLIVQTRGGAFSSSAIGDPILKIKIRESLERNTSYKLEEVWMDEESHLRMIFVAKKHPNLKNDIKIAGVEGMSAPFNQVI